ncbi:hypothetical protein BASA81_012570 [Batrachochytrium salamandrivorans]|nr:hypothetical protein BASA81_012570 [Batrachochytrium salamandrivorans]
MAISKPEEDFDDEEDLEEEEDEGEEDEEDDLEEEEEDDEIIEVTDFKSTPPRPLGKSPERWTQPQRELVSSLFEMMDHMHTEQACYAVLLETNWDLGDAANHLLDAKHTTAIRTSASPSPMSFNERENLDICHRVQSMEDLASTGVAAAAGDTKESLCNSVRHRLLYEDKKIAWSDGACAVQVCLHSMQTACGDLDAISKPERLLIVECLNRAVGIMLDQPLGPHQENFVYALGVVDAGVEIAVLMLQVKKNPVLLEVLNTALQHDRALWKASAQTHYMKCRAQLLGNQALVQAIFEESSWAANPNEIANQALVFARHAGQSAMAASVVKRRLLEGPLKNDSAMDAVFKELAEAERREVGEDNSTKRGKFDSFYYFWFNEFAMRPFMENVSLEQRLFGLAQLERLVDTLTVMAMQTNNKRAKSTLFPALVGTGNSETDPPAATTTTTHSSSCDKSLFPRPIVRVAHSMRLSSLVDGGVSIAHGDLAQVEKGSQVPGV